MLTRPVWLAAGVQVKIAGLGLTVFEVIVAPTGAFPRLQTRLAGVVLVTETRKVNLEPALTLVLGMGLITSWPSWPNASGGKQRRIIPSKQALKRERGRMALACKRSRPLRGTGRIK